MRPCSASADLTIASAAVLVGLCDRTEAAQLLLGDFEYGCVSLSDGKSTQMCHAHLQRCFQGSADTVPSPYRSYFLAALEHMCKEAKMPLQGNSDALLEMASKLPKSVVK